MKNLAITEQEKEAARKKMVYVIDDSDFDVMLKQIKENKSKNKKSK